METSIVTNTLTDGSKTYDVVFVDGSQVAVINAVDELGAVAIQECLATNANGASIEWEPRDDQIEIRARELGHMSVDTVVLLFCLAFAVCAVLIKAAVTPSICLVPNPFYQCSTDTECEQMWDRREGAQQ